ncbi:PucR family transcriptional regulator [Flindersiella endophytica]
MLLTELQALTDDVATRLGAATVLEDEEQRMVAYSSQTQPIDDVRRDSILRRTTRPEVRDWFRKFGIVASTAPVRIPSDRSAGILGRVCIPVRHHGLLIGYLWLIDDEQRLGEADLSVAVSAARHAGLLMYEELLASRLADNLVGHLLSPSDELRATACLQATEAGLLEADAQVAVGVVRLPDAEVAQPKALIAEALRDVSRVRPRAEFLGLAHADHAVVLSRARSARLVATQVVDAARAVRGAVADRLSSSGLAGEVVLGVGDPQDRPPGAYLSYRQARMAATAAAAIPEFCGVGVWSSLGVYRVLAQLSGEAVEDALDPRVARLLAELDPQVLETVERYLDHGSDARATIDELHLSRGTLYYRLNKVEQTGGLDLHDGKDRMSLYLGLKLARFAGRYPSASADKNRWPETA